MKQNSIRGSKTERILQDAKIALLGILTLLFIVVTVIEAFFASAGDIGVEEPITVSSALISKGGTSYTSSIMGVLVNNGETAIKVDRITVTVDGGRTETVNLETPTLILPRNTERIYYTWESRTAYDRVLDVEVTVNGEVQAIYNLPNQSGILPVVVCLVLAALSGWLLSRAVRVRYYMWQELKMPSDL